MKESKFSSISDETIASVVTESILEHGEKLSRGKLFKDCFERIESLTNKTLDDGHKKTIRKEVEAALNRVSARTETEQAIQIKAFQDIDKNTDLVIGRTVKYLDSRQLGFVEELQRCYEVLRLQLKKMAEVPDGDDKREGMESKLRRYKNAVYGRLADAGKLVELDAYGIEDVQRIRQKMDEKFGNTPKSGEVMSAEIRAMGYLVQ